MGLKLNKTELYLKRPCSINTKATLFFRRCSGCKKKRSLRTNSFFEEFPKVPLATLLFVMYNFATEDSQIRTARTLDLTPGLVSKIFRVLQDVCSRDIADRPITPFGGAGAVLKCNESKFNHKAKVRQPLVIVSLQLFHLLSYILKYLGACRFL